MGLRIGPRLRMAIQRLTEEILPIGTKVYVRTEGINDKLYPRFRGPFTVVDYTEFGNYVIENLMRERMSDSYPLQRLKSCSRQRR